MQFHVVLMQNYLTGYHFLFSIWRILHLLTGIISIGLFQSALQMEKPVPKSQWWISTLFRTMIYSFDPFYIIVVDELSETINTKLSTQIFIQKICFFHMEKICNDILCSTAKFMKFVQWVEKRHKMILKLWYFPKLCDSKLTWKMKIFLLEAFKYPNIVISTVWLFEYFRLI